MLPLIDAFFPMRRALNPLRAEGENQMADEQREREEKVGEDRRGLVRDRRASKGGQSGDNDSGRREQDEQERGPGLEGRKS
jgi:hypothetical protein